MTRFILGERATPLPNLRVPADPRLTELGQLQAQEAHSAWKEERDFNIPIPEKLYCSPLTRAIQTNQLTFDESIVPGLEVIILEVSPGNPMNAQPLYAVHTRS